MSTSAQQLAPIAAPVERRFYRRTVPSSLIYIDFGDARISSSQRNTGMLLNLSENGLLVSTPLGLTPNFVYRVSIPLNGLLTKISVRVRVVWTNELRRAGIQMLDLSEHDRDQIRKWAELEGGPNLRSEPPTVPPRPVPSARHAIPQCAKPTVLSSPSAEPRKKEAPTVNAPFFRSAANPATTRRRKLALAGFLGLLLASLAAATFFGDRPLRQSLSNKSSFFTSMLDLVRVHQNRPAATPAMATNSENQPEPDQLPPLPIIPPDGSASDPSGPGFSRAESPAEPESALAAEGTVPHSPIAQLYPEERRAFRPDSLPPAAIALKRERNRTNIDWDAASEQPPRLPEPENLDDSGPPTNLLANAPSGITSIPAAPFLVATPPPRPRIGQSPRPAVVSVDAPQNRVPGVTPNNHSGALNVPGERVFESVSVTTRVQRSILMPAGRTASSVARGAKLLIGELLSRVDPQPPHFPVRPGSIVTIRAVIDKNGRVETLKPVSGSITLVPNVARAVREWRYQPTLLDGKPVETESLIVFEFHSSPAPQPQM